jgi:hypothetical protein
MEAISELALGLWHRHLRVDGSQLSATGPNLRDQ